MSIRELPDDLKSIAKKELNENTKRINEDIEYIIEWLKKQPHIKARTDPQWLVAFLRGAKYSRERTKEKLDAFYTVRSLLPEIFLGRDPLSDSSQEILDLGTYLPLPDPATKNGPRLILLRPSLYDPKKYMFESVLQVFYMIIDILLLEDDRLNILGQISIVDLAGTKLEHMGQATPALMKKCIASFQDGYAIKVKAVHFINPPSGFDVVLSIVKTFMNAKLRDRVHVHSKPSNLFKFIPKSVLPVDYGGEAISLEDLTKKWKKTVEEHRNWLIEDAQYRVDDSKRLEGKKINKQDIFGVDGSFKKLDID